MAAAWAYFDTSVLVKRYLREAGSDTARGLFRRYRLLTSAIAPVEAMSALSRRLMTGDLAERDFQAIRVRVLKDKEHWEMADVTSDVLGRAEEFVQRTPLRTLDAIHVATAACFESLSGLRVPFVTADERQRAVASQLQMNVVWIG